MTKALGGVIDRRTESKNNFLSAPFATSLSVRRERQGARATLKGLFFLLYPGGDSVNGISERELEDYLCEHSELLQFDRFCKQTSECANDR